MFGPLWAPPTGGGGPWGGQRRRRDNGGLPGRKRGCVPAVRCDHDCDGALSSNECHCCEEDRQSDDRELASGTHVRNLAKLRGTDAAGPIRETFDLPQFLPDSRAGQVGLKAYVGPRMPWSWRPCQPWVEPSRPPTGTFTVRSTTTGRPTSAGSSRGTLRKTRARRPRDPPRDVVRRSQDRPVLYGSGFSDFEVKARDLTGWPGIVLAKDRASALTGARRGQTCSASPTRRASGKLCGMR